MARFGPYNRPVISAEELTALERRAKKALSSVRRMPPGLARRDAIKEAFALHARAAALCKYARAEKLITSRSSDVLGRVERR